LRHGLRGGVAVAQTEPETVTLEGDGTSTNPYKIGNYAQLVKFANIVNGEKGETKKSNAYAELTADIVANEDLLNTDGTLNNNNPENTWTPINYSSSFGLSGTFDGKGHTISGLYISNTDIRNVGLFGTNQCTIKNVGVIDSYFNAPQSAHVGGVCGYNNGGKIYNCYNTGTVTGGTSVGGVCGNDNSGTIQNCYNTGTVTGTETNANVGGVCGLKIGGGIYNCYYLKGTASNGIGNGSDSATEMFEDDFKSGKVAWRLNGNNDYTSVGEDKTSPWLQNLSGDNENPKDDYPVLTTKVKKCIAVKKDGDSYSNFENHSYDNATLADYPEAGTNNLYSYVCDHCKDISSVLTGPKVIKQLNGNDNIVIEKNNDNAWQTQTEEQIILNDDNSYKAPVEFIATGGASYSREISTQWATLCLPFDIEAKTTDYKTYNLSVVGDTQITLTEITGENATVTAGTPVFVKRTSTATTVNFNATATANVTMMETPNGRSCTGAKGLTGVFKRTTLSQNSNNLFIKEDNMWSMAQAGKSMTVKPFRAYIVPNTPISAPKLSITIDGEATAISDALDTLNDTNAEYYDINGRRISSLQKGVNIIKSGNKTRKVIIK